jgi:hypothetical protein
MSNWQNVIKDDSETDDYEQSLAYNIKMLIGYLEKAISGGQVSESELEDIFKKYEIRFDADEFRVSNYYV